MSYSKKSRSRKIKGIMFSLSVFAVTALIVGFACFFYLNGAASENPVVKENGSGIPDKTRMVVRAKCNLKPGDPVSLEKVEAVQVPLDFAPENAAVSVAKIKGMLLKHAVQEKELITLNDLMPQNSRYEDGDRLIEHNFADGAVPATVSAGDLIDIKLFRHGGEDSVVVSKAAVVSRDANLLGFYLNSREQEYLKESAAEGMLFTVRYIDEIQSESSVTYIPKYDKKSN